MRNVNSAIGRFIHQSSPGPSTRPSANRGNLAIRMLRGVARVCRLVPLLPVVIVAALPLALLWDYRPWGATPWPFDPSLGQWVVIALVAYTVVDTLRGMIDDIRHGHVGVDILAVVAILSTLAVREYWASWAVTLMIASGEAIEEYAQSKAESSLTALMQAAPVVAHVVNLPGVGANAKRTGAARAHNFGADGRAVDGRDVDGRAVGVGVAGKGVAGAGANEGRDGRDSDRGFRPTVPADAVCALTGREASDCEPAIEEAVQSVQAVQAVQSPAGGGAHFNTVPVGKVRLGDVLIVLPGETVPVDGELLSGSATLDLSAINGEPMPREVYAGARVMSGAVNGSSTITIRATELARDSQYQRIMELVSSAQSSRATVVKTADLLAVPFTVVAFIIAGVAWIVSGVPTRFAQVLVLATPCPLLIAAPVAYMAGTGRLARHGILVKAQEVLENLGRVSHAFFDKTGTLTVKKPRVVRVEKPVASSSPSASTSPVMSPSSVPVSSPSSSASPATSPSSSPSPAGVPRPDQPADGSQERVLDGGANAINHESDRELDAIAESVGFPRLDDDHILMFAGIIEGYSVHILAEGIAAAGKEALARLHERYAAGQRACPQPEAAWPGHGRDYPVVKDVREDAGNGVSGEVNGHSVRVGRFAFVAQGTGDFGAFAVSRERLFPEALAADEMATYVAVDSVIVARIVLKDVPRANAASTMDRLRALGVGRLTMLTGDKESSARIIAGEVGVDDVRAELFPEDKVAAVRNATVGAPRPTPWWDRIVSRMAGESVARPVVMMVGDGVNDAPVLAASDIGIAITDGMSTAASQSAQVVIMNDNIAGVADAVAIARRTKRVMLQAVAGGLALATVFMIAAAFDVIPVVVGAFIQEGIDVVSILWALMAAADRE